MRSTFRWLRRGYCKIIALAPFPRGRTFEPLSGIVFLARVYQTHQIGKKRFSWNVFIPIGNFFPLPSKRLCPSNAANPSNVSFAFVRFLSARLSRWRRELKIETRRVRKFINSNDSSSIRGLNCRTSFSFWFYYQFFIIPVITLGIYISVNYGNYAS